MTTRKLTSLVLCAALLLCCAACGGAAADADAAPSAEKTSIVFADVGWDSVLFHNAVAGTVAEAVFGYEWSETSGSTPITHEALMKGEIDVHMETWTNNLPSYSDDLAAGRLKELSTNFDDNYQGFYIPRYVADANPGLKSVSDLKDYVHLFPDPMDKAKGRIYGGIPGWEITEIMRKKVEFYGLDKMYTYTEPGSDAAMNAALVSAWDKQEPIVAYYWEPTWLLGLYDFVLLEDAPYDPDTYLNGECECPAVTVTVCASNDFYETNPAYCEFLSKYETSSALTSEALGYMQKNEGADYRDTAKWFLTEGHPELVDEWLTPEQAKRLFTALGSPLADNYDVEGDFETGSDEASPLDWMFTFPLVLDLDVAAIDSATRGFAAKYSWLFEDIIGDGLTRLVSFINRVLNHIPWFVLIGLVFFLGRKVRRSTRSGALYALCLSFIGFVGLWELMNMTLSIVLAGVLISLLIGLPIGVLLSSSAGANAIARPILDTMQTMPVFVYLIPALLFFGMGPASAVIATVIYAVVPVIRLTSLGIRQVDKEVVEAARSFGSTNWQTLFKVQIPQAMPTIMTGVNQTLMMAMAMVVTCSMIGARGLGNEVLIAVNRTEIGRGILAGSSVVILAVILDRLTQGWFTKKPNTPDFDSEGGKKQ